MSESYVTLFSALYNILIHYLKRYYILILFLILSYSILRIINITLLIYRSISITLLSWLPPISFYLLYSVYNIATLTL